MAGYYSLNGTRAQASDKTRSPLIKLSLSLGNFLFTLYRTNNNHGGALRFLAIFRCGQGAYGGAAARRRPWQREVA